MQTLPKSQLLRFVEEAFHLAQRAVSRYSLKYSALLKPSSRLAVLSEAAFRTHRPRANLRAALFSVNEKWFQQSQVFETTLRNRICVRAFVFFAPRSPDRPRKTAFRRASTRCRSRCSAPRTALSRASTRRTPSRLRYQRLRPSASSGSRRPTTTRRRSSGSRPPAPVRRRLRSPRY